MWYVKNQSRIVKIFKPLPLQIKIDGYMRNRRWVWGSVSQEPLLRTDKCPGMSELEVPVEALGLTYKDATLEPHCGSGGAETALPGWLGFT